MHLIAKRAHRYNFQGCQFASSGLRRCYNPRLSCHSAARACQISPITASGVRLAVAGKVTPPIGATLALLTRAEALCRMRRVLT